MHMARISAVLALTLLAMLCPTAPKAAMLQGAHNIFETGDKIPDQYKYFTQAMGAPTESMSRKQFHCLRDAHPTESFAIYRVPSTPGARPRFPYSVVTASYASKAEADSSLLSTRMNIDFRKVLTCLRTPRKIDDAFLALVEANTFVYSLNVPREHWQIALERTPLEPFDGIGMQRFEAGTKTITAVIRPLPVSLPVVVSALITDYQAAHPDVHFASIRHGNYYYVAVASFVDGEGAQSALSAMRQRGLYELAYRSELSPNIVKSTMQTTAKTWDVLGNEIEVKPIAITEEAMAAPIELLETEDLREPLADRVKRCYSVDGHNFSGQIEQLASCAGVVLTPDSLTRCLLGSECLGMRVPIGYLQDSRQRVINCLSSSDAGAECLGTTIDPLIFSLLKKANFSSCMQDINSNDCKAVSVTLKTVCDDTLNKQICVDHEQYIKNIDGRRDDILRCIANGNCRSLVANPLETKARVIAEAKRLMVDLDRPIDPVSTALSFLEGRANDQVNRFKSCLEKRDAGNNVEAEKCFLEMSLRQSEKDIYQCINATQNDSDKIACVNRNDGIAVALAAASCVRNARSDLSLIAKCAGGEASQVTSAIECASAKTSVMDVAMKCVGTLPPDLAAAIKCIQPNGTAKDIFECLPGNSAPQATTFCIAGAKTDSERLTCVAEGLKLNPEVSQAVACIAQSNGNTSAMTKCAAEQFMPKELALAVSCASTSTGAVSFALCAAGPKMNEELRIAAECAVSTGGNPVAFAGCTAGRLTIRELTKCMQGEIGKEGGCFGPNNSLVKTVSTVLNDITKGPGPNNDLVIALGKITNPINDFVGGVDHEIEKIKDGFRRNDIGRTINNWLGH
jgi:hypothetical protein